MRLDAFELQISGCTGSLFRCIFKHSMRGWATILCMHDSTLRPQPVRWLWIAAIWTAVALFSATQNVVVMRAEGMHHAWTKLFFYLALSWLPFALSTPIVLYLGRRYPPFRIKAFSVWAIHLAASLAICFIWAGWMTAMDQLLNPWADPVPSRPVVDMWLDKFYNDLLVSFLLYTAILVVGQMLESRERLARQEMETARLNEQLSQARLEALRRQVEPHFLFNTLHGIAALVREERNDEAVSMIAGLSDFLRGVLEDSHRQQAPLGDEMHFLQKYLDIEKMRLGNRLRVDIHVPPELLAAHVPSLILQPMVENSIKHGISKRAQGGEIRIAAVRNNGTLTLSVYNDGPALPDGWENSQPGIGISNVRARLQSLYGKHFEFRLHNQPPSGVQVSLSVPFQE
jgi:two-component system, LytTR family, sensor kinase